MALAVLGVAIYPRLSWLGEDGHDVTAAETGDRQRRAELPEVVEVHCSPEGIDVPVGTIQPQDDGLHVLVDNTMSVATDFRVESDDWDSGLIRVEAGRTRRLALPVAPGPLAVGCEVGGESQQRRVELVDVDGIYEPPELACRDDDERVGPGDPVTIEETNSPIAATEVALGLRGIDIDDVEVEYYSGYREAHRTEHTVDPMVEVLEAGQLVAFAHMRSATMAEDRPARPPWVAVSFEGCSTFMQNGSPGGGAGTTATQP